MEKIEVMINGAKYPCRPTMGAIIKFEKLTGKGIKEFDANTFTDNCLFLYCCIASACAADKVTFNISFEDFADAMDYTALQQWVTAYGLNKESVE